MTHGDPFNLERFVAAQDVAYERALDELRSGTKRSHWIWFVFPQIAGLGASSASQFYGIGSLAEARAYLAHSILGPRLRSAVRIMLSLEGGTLRQILGSPDDLKFRSSMTLFAEADEDGSLFREALLRFCPDGKDARTLRLLQDVCRQGP